MGHFLIYFLQLIFILVHFFWFLLELAQKLKRYFPIKILYLFLSTYYLQTWDRFLIQTSMRDLRSKWNFALMNFSGDIEFNFANFSEEAVLIFCHTSQQTCESCQLKDNALFMSLIALLATLLPAASDRFGTVLINTNHLNLISLGTLLFFKFEFIFFTDALEFTLRMFHQEAWLCENGFLLAHQNNILGSKKYWQLILLFVCKNLSYFYLISHNKLI